ncbi:flagellar biosynthetic protein FliR [Dyella koreensis]
MHRLPALFATVVWPFCRFLAAFAVAPVLGEAMVPMRVRALAALALAVVAQPGLPPLPALEPFSVAGVEVMAEQILIGGMLGFAFHLVLSGLLVLGTLVSAQMGLSMAVMNDPINGTASDAMSSLLYTLFVLLFFAVDGHLVLTQVLARSFHVWPIGGVGMAAVSLERLAHGVGWVSSVALMLALPLVFAIMVIQMGMGFLQRVAPSLNLFSLGFSITTVFGLLLMTALVPALPEHFGRMMAHVLELLDGMAVAGSAT